MKEYIIKEQYNTITEQTRFIICNLVTASTLCGVGVIQRYKQHYSPMVKEEFGSKEYAEARLRVLLIPHAWETVK